MKKYISLLGVIIILVVILFLSISSCSNKSDEVEVLLIDKAFESMIKKELNKDTIYESDLSEISGIMIASDRLISFSGGGHTEKSVILFGFEEYEYEDVRYKEFGTIKSLADLAYFPKLSNIRIYLQPNIDFNTIPNKGNIYNLALSQNKIDNLNFLEGFDKLNYLTLSSNQIVNLDGIENVSNIKRLGLNSNDVINIDVLSNFKNLEHLDLTYNAVKDVSSLANLTKLSYLSLYENGISDISPLSKIKSLNELYLNNNNITDISPLKGFTSFEALNISGNDIANYEEILHIDNVVK